MSALYNLNAEANLLGILIIDNDIFTDILKLNPEDFYDDKNKIIFANMKSLYSRGQKFDEVVLSTKMPGCDLAEAGGITYLMSLSQSVSTTRTAVPYARIIKDFALKRDIIKNNKLLEKDIEGKSVSEISAFLETAASSLYNSSVRDTGEFKEVLVSLVTKIEDRYKNGAGITGISTGYNLMDKALNGFNKGDLIILAARPSMGKTTLALNLFFNTILKGSKAAAFFSLEMTKEQLLTKAISSISHIEHGSLLKGSLQEDEFPILVNTLNILEEKENAAIYDTMSDMSEIKRECKKLKMQSRLDAVFIDYLQLIITKEKFPNRTAEVTYISSQLKLLAKELNVPVICLSQLNRAVEARAFHMPGLADLRDSGSIEQDADIIMFLYREDYYDPDSEEKNLIHILVQKNRQGETCQFKLNWKPEYCSVTDLN